MKNLKANVKAIVIVGLVLAFLSKVQVQANVARASCSANVLALIAGVVAFLVLVGIVILVFLITREFRAGVYRPRHAS